MDPTPLLYQTRPSLINPHGTITSSRTCLSMKNNIPINVISYLCLSRYQDKGHSFCSSPRLPNTVNAHRMPVRNMCTGQVGFPSDAEPWEPERNHLCLKRKVPFFCPSPTGGHSSRTRLWESLLVTHLFSLGTQLVSSATESPRLHLASPFSNTRDSEGTKVPPGLTFFSKFQYLGMIRHEWQGAA